MPFIHFLKLESAIISLLLGLLLVLSPLPGIILFTTPYSSHVSTYLLSFGFNFKWHFLKRLTIVASVGYGEPAQPSSMLWRWQRYWMVIHIHIHTHPYLNFIWVYYQRKVSQLYYIEPTFLSWFYVIFRASNVSFCFFGITFHYLSLLNTITNNEI